jgi:ATP-dependent protease ClpP protease subunit
MERRARWRPSNLKPPTRTPDQPLLRITNALGTDGGSACLYLLGPIDEMGAEWGGVSAAEFIAALNGVQAGRLDLRVSSPGGSFHEACAMRAALVAHPAYVTAYVDGLAASAASVLITGADKVIQARGAQQMCHRASCLAIGTAADLRADADLLDKVDRDIAGFYLERSGQGSVESWLSAMDAETWYTAEEAVAAGLADEIAADPVRTRDTETEQVPVAASVDHWILATYRYAGRGEAPSPVTAEAEPATGEPVFDAVGAEARPVELAEPAEPAPLTAPLLDDDAVARIAEAVAERLAQRTPAPTPEAAPTEAAPSETPATPAPQVAPVAAALPPTALTVEALAPQFDPALFRAAIRKAAS